MYFAIKTFGCKVNQYESNSISSSMQERGFFLLQDTRDFSKPDILIINSCTVTENTDKKVRQLIKIARKQNNNIIIALIGCFPTAFPDRAKELGVDIILGTRDKSMLPQILNDYFENKNLNKIELIKCNFDGYEEFQSIQKNSSIQTRAYIKIEDGCERFCSYCIIPKARGKVRSRGISEIKKEAVQLVNSGHMEIVLVGINLSCYGQDTGLTLCDAVEAVAEIDGILRVRLSSLEPDFLDKDVIKRLSAIKKLCPHFHLSLQSGCDSTLLRMNRHYTTDDYFGIVENLKKNFPNCAVTTDIMVGFAGETDIEFHETLDFVKRINFSKIHVFTYSIRQGTAAAERTDHIEESIKADRYRLMSGVAVELEKRFFESQINSEHQILIERRTSPDYVLGHSANYLPVRVYGENCSRYELLNVRIAEAGDKYCVGVKL